jgi:hypothetical protein
MTCRGPLGGSTAVLDGDRVDVDEAVVDGFEVGGSVDGGMVVDAAVVVGIVSVVDVVRSCVVGTTGDGFEESPAQAPTTTDNTSTARTRPAGDCGGCR